MKKSLSVIKTVFVWIVILIAVSMMIFTIISATTLDRGNRSLLGYKAFIVKSDSMKATDFAAGDLVLAKEVDPSTLKEGDIISFQSTNTESYGETFTHKIRRLTTDAEGNPGFITYGTTTNTDDESVVTYSFILGKYVGKIPNLGTFFSFLKTTPGYILCVFLPFLILIMIQGVNSIRLFKRYKAEQLSEMQAERDKEKAELAAEREAMAEERKRQEELMQKLLEMQANMQGAEKQESVTADKLGD